MGISLCRYYHNITSVVLEAMAEHHVKTIMYSSTCVTYGEPLKMPITEQTPQMPINPYGKAKKMSEDIIIDFFKTTNMAVMILSVIATIMSLPSPSTAGRLLLLLKSIGEVSETSSSKRSKKKSAYSIGSLVQAEILLKLSLWN
ncbi:putative UDP-arabinose 4-epimerase 2 [Pistacia vera]|uniref:putative UDP-arabinose 4-epimerase 2 n=1 Tax=Pistacia vera TaxID=55513 RepID=UPI001262D8A3|nr:putative UDP-arabinose 4-epimerase 2 [Pistacia vera]